MTIKHSSLTWRLWLIGCMILAGGIWGLVPSLAKMATLADADPLGTTFWQATAGGVLLLALTWMRGRRLYLSRHHIWFYVFCGFTGTSVPTVIILMCSAYISAGLISIVIALTPIMTYAILLTMGRELLIPLRLVGVVLGFVAVGLIVVPDAEWTMGSLTAWAILAMAVPLCYSAENVVLSVKRPPYSDEISLVAGMLLASGVVLAPVVVLTGTYQPMGWPWGVAQFSIAGMVVFNVISYVMFLYLVRVAGAVYASQCGYWSMLLGVFWGIVVWDETHSVWNWLAVILMVAGMFLVKEHTNTASTAPGGTA